jgi:uncharacterized protein (DUF169 family)
VRAEDTRVTITDYGGLERKLAKHLELAGRPVAVTYLDAIPSEIAKFTGTMPSGCSFWRLAAEGRTFYTLASDHYNCPVGSYTHNIPLPSEREQELPQVLSFMTQIGYLRAEEVPGIPQLPKTPKAIVYAPLGETPLDPDVIVLAGRPRGIMQLQECAQRARVSTQAGILGRPTCMALPAAMARGVVASTGCIGNRVYTDVGDDNLYVAVRGRDLAAIVDEVPSIAAANAKLEEYHRGRRQMLATG